MLPYFTPPYEAVRLHCNLCGKELRREKFLTERVRNIEAATEGGQYVFCPPCSSIATTVAQRIEDARTRAQLAFNETLDGELRDLAQGSIAELLPEQARPADASASRSAAAVSSSTAGTPSRRRGTQPPRGTYIPTPERA